MALSHLNYFLQDLRSNLFCLKLQYWDRFFGLHGFRALLAQGEQSVCSKTDLRILRIESNFYVIWLNSLFSCFWGCKAWSGWNILCQHKKYSQKGFDRALICQMDSSWRMLQIPTLLVSLKSIRESMLLKSVGFKYKL